MKRIRQSLSLLLLLISLPLALFLVRQIAQYASQASGTPADILVDLSQPAGFLPRPWRGIAQGGEELYTFLNNTNTRVKAISPKYIRIDHIYNGFDVVKKNGQGQLTFDWTRLDKVVDQIRSTGATPFFALSYMPPAIAKTDIVSTPHNWADWTLVVENTIERYSGTKKIPDVYYEVWNEPDLFGSFKAGTYLPLYRASALGAARASNVLPFKFGGPATTGLYKSWVDLLLKSAQNESLRLDFISWHRYDTDPERHIQDIEEVESWISNYPNFSGIEVIISEWGPFSNNHPWYDSISGAAHLIATTRLQMDRINLAFPFSIKDGADPKGQAYWGRWGLFTSDATGNKAKPRYTALLWLTSLGDERLSLSGEGSWVKAIAAQKNGVIQLLLTNYDAQSKHSETVPLTFNSLPPGVYSVKQRFLSGPTVTNDIPALLGTLKHQIYLKPNDSVFVELTIK